MTIALTHSTGMAPLDARLCEVIDIFERSYPGRIRSYILGGSYSDGTAVGSDRSPNSSDLDLFVIFRGTTSEIEKATFPGLVEASRRSSPMALDAHAFAENDLLQPRPEISQASFLTALIQVAGVFVYGEDIRADLPEVPFPRYVLDVIESGVFHLGLPRQQEAPGFPLGAPLLPPLAYPNPDGEFYGYDVLPGPDAPGGTRVLVAITAWIATLILALETGRCVGQKSQCLQLCQEYLPRDGRTQLATTIFETCKRAWGYALPASEVDRKRLRGWCRETLALENDYLRLCRDYLLAQLQHGKVDEQRQATGILQSILYRDEEIRAALTTLEQSPDAGVRSGAEKALEILRCSSP
jgi:hypothetical protein